MAPPEGPTRARLLRAAVEEFARHGLAGARVERIAERAGANKQLVYYYFGSKDGLFDAAVTAMARRLADEEPAGRSLSDWLTGEARRHDDEPHWTRLLAYEALQRGDREVPDEAARRDAARRAVRRVRAEQRAGRLPQGLDAAQLLLAVHALSSHAATFPQLVRHATGRAADDPAAVRARNRFLRDLAARIER